MPPAHAPLHSHPITLRDVGWLTLGAAAFALVVVLNAGGYRYGISDQAFYIPVILHQLTPELFPHDAPLLAAQDRFLIFDDWFAPVVSAAGLSLPAAFAVAYAATILLLYAAVVAIGRSLCATWWGVAALVVGLTLRHRIADTAVNSFEGYFHPRLLAFALGATAIAFFLRGRTWRALLIIALGYAVHPTTAIWFGILIGTAALVADRTARPTLIVLATAAGVMSAIVLLGPLRGNLARMDAAWIDVLSSKDYLFATQWPLLTWLGHLALPAVMAGVYTRRRNRGLATPREAGLVYGSFTLLGVFLASVPFADARIALAVQLQVNRVFWLLDFVASCYVAWWLVDDTSPHHPPWRWLRQPRRGIVILLAVLALSRGVYRTYAEGTDHQLIRLDIAADDWGQIMEWASQQPIGTHFLADPIHAARYGSSVRAAAGRDVYLETIKDSAIAIYSPAMARRVASRTAALGHFNELDEARARTLADRYELHYLITDRQLDLPAVLTSGHLFVYRLAPDQPAS